MIIKITDSEEVKELIINYMDKIDCIVTYQDGTRMISVMGKRYNITEKQYAKLKKQLIDQYKPITKNMVKNQVKF